MKILKKLNLLLIFVLPTIAFAIGGSGPLDNLKEKGLKNERPPYMDRIGIEEHLGDSVTKELEFKNEEGKTVKLSDYVKEKPVFLMLVYYNCPTLCSTHLNSVLGTLSNFEMKPGQEYEYVAVSIDPSEDGKLAKEKKAIYLKEFGLEKYAEGMHFLTGDKENINKLASEVGFKFAWDTNMKQWAHAAASFVLTPKGQISYYHYGLSLEPKVFRLSLVEASGNKIGDVMDKVLLFCLQYDPTKKTYAFYAFNIMRVAAGLTALVLIIFLVRFWLSNKSQK